MKFRKPTAITPQQRDPSLCGCGCERAIPDNHPAFALLLLRLCSFIDGKQHANFSHQIGVYELDCLKRWFGTPDGIFAPVHHPGDLPPPTPCLECAASGVRVCNLCDLRDLVGGTGGADACKLCSGTRNLPCIHCHARGEVELTEFWCSHDPQYQGSRFSAYHRDLHMTLILKVRDAAPVVLKSDQPVSCPCVFNEYWQEPGHDEIEQLIAMLPEARAAHVPGASYTILSTDPIFGPMEAQEEVSDEAQ